jgi:hypothetical protein
MGELCILDLDSCNGEKRYVKIDGEKIYIKKVPAMTTMLYDQVVQEGAKIESVEDSQNVMKKLARAVLIAINCGKEKKYDEEWLLERCEYKDLSAIIAALHEPLKKNMPESQAVKK